MVWPGPIDEFFHLCKDEDGMDKREELAELAGKNVAEWVRIVFPVDDLQAAYDADSAKVRSLFVDVFRMVDLRDRLGQRRYELTRLNGSTGLGAPLRRQVDPRMVQEQYGFTLKYPHLPCLILEDMCSGDENS